MPLGKFFPARPFFYGDRPCRGKKKKTILTKIFPSGFLKVEADTTPRPGNQPATRTWTGLRRRPKDVSKAKTAVVRPKKRRVASLFSPRRLPAAAEGRWSIASGA